MYKLAKDVNNVVVVVVVAVIDVVVVVVLLWYVWQEKGVGFVQLLSLTCVHNTMFSLDCRLTIGKRQSRREASSRRTAQSNMVSTDTWPHCQGFCYVT